MSDATPAVADEEMEEAEAALSTVDSEFGRTTDPVRMYMREMGTVELLTREGEIEIAKRIEDGLKHMIQAISACPGTVAEVLALIDRIEAGEMRVDELIDGFIDPDAPEEEAAEFAEPATKNCSPMKKTTRKKTKTAKPPLRSTTPIWKNSRRKPLSTLAWSKPCTSRCSRRWKERQPEQGLS